MNIADRLVPSLISIALLIPWTAAGAELSFERATDDTGLGHFHDYVLNISPEEPIPMPVSS